MKRLFVYEHVCGGGFCGSALPPGLRAEGEAMLTALLADLSRCSDVQLATTLDVRLSAARIDRRVQTVLVGTPQDAVYASETLASGADGVLVIAPETDGILTRTLQRFEELGVRVLGPSSSLVDVLSDKLELSRRLLRRGLPALVAVPLESAASFASRELVVKPRRGAGSSNIRRLSRTEAGRRYDASGERGGMIVTPWHPGIPASVLALCGEREILPLLAGEQIMTRDGLFRYEGGRIPLPPRLASRATELALRILRSFRGLRGFVGVDMLLGTGNGTPSDVVVELNPRLTTSYIGLRALTRDNLALCLLEILEGVDARPPRWREGSVAFAPNGKVCEQEGVAC